MSTNVQSLIGPRGYKVEKELGAGAFGIVYKAMDKTGKTVAVKVINLEKLSDNTKNKCLPREIDTLMKCHHENIIRTYDVFRTDTRLFIFMQFAPNGDIRGYSKKNDGIKDPLACKWFVQSSRGLSYLHGTLFTTHRDIKPDNILLDEQMHAVMTDFGFAKKCYDTSKDVLILSKTFCGTKPYEPPQIIDHKAYNGFKADVWSMGITFYAMLHKRKYPFDHDDKKTMLRQQVRKYPKHLVHSLRKDLPNDAIHLFKDMLNPNEKERASVNDILRNNWLRSKAKAAK